MDGSPIHLACDRWTAVLIRHFAAVIHDYFDNLYSDAITVSATQGKGKNQSFVDGVFQKWCKAVEKDWTFREAESQLNALRAKYQDLETLIANVLHSNLVVMSVYRRGNVKEINIPEEGTDKFVRRCYWNVARDVGFPYPIYFNTAIRSAERSIYHNKARKLITKVLMETVIETIQPTLDKMNEKEEKRKKRHRKRSPGRKTKEVDVGELTEENLKKFTEDKDYEAIRALEEYKNQREREIAREMMKNKKLEQGMNHKLENLERGRGKNSKIAVEQTPEVYPDDSASRVYLRPGGNVIEESPELVEETPVKSVSSSKSKQNSVNFIPERLETGSKTSKNLEKYNSNSIRGSLRHINNSADIVAVGAISTPQTKIISEKPSSVLSQSNKITTPSVNVKSISTPQVKLATPPVNISTPIQISTPSVKVTTPKVATPVPLSITTPPVKLSTPKVATPLVQDMSVYRPLPQPPSNHSSIRSNNAINLNQPNPVEIKPSDTIVLPVSGTKHGQKSGMEITLQPVNEIKPIPVNDSKPAPVNEQKLNQSSENESEADDNEEDLYDDFEEGQVYYDYDDAELEDDDDDDEESVVANVQNTKPQITVPSALPHTQTAVPTTQPTKPSAPLTPPKRETRAPTSDKFFKTNSDFF
jgi:hypothetical protein